MRGKKITIVLAVGLLWAAASDQEQASHSEETLTYISHLESGDGNEINAVYDFDIS